MNLQSPCLSLPDGWYYSRASLHLAIILFLNEAHRSNTCGPVIARKVEGGSRVCVNVYTCVCTCVFTLAYVCTRSTVVNKSLHISWRKMKKALWFGSDPHLFLQPFFSFSIPPLLHSIHKSLIRAFQNTEVKET